MNRVAVVIPAYNEPLTIGAVVRGAQALGCDVFVVSDASTDDTRERALEAGAEVLSLPFTAGAWCAAQAGMLHAIKKGRYERFLTMDGDGQHDPASIPVLMDAMDESGASVVIGSCPERGSRARKLVWKIFYHATGLNIRDLTSGLRLYDARAVSLLLTRSAVLFDYQDLGVLLLLRRHSLALHERPVPMRPRRDGCSRVFRSWWAVAVYMLKTAVLILSDRVAAPGESAEDWREYDLA